jgi:predicted ATPase
MQRMSRQAEREAIVELLRSVEQQRTPAVLELVGEAGIGKTTLLETVDESPRVGRLVLRGRAAEFEGDLPYGLFIDALDAYLAGIGERPSGVLDPADLAELAGVFPALERRVAAPAVLVREERFRFHRAVRSLLEQVAGRGSAVPRLTTSISPIRPRASCWPRCCGALLTVRCCWRSRIGRGGDRRR